MILVNDIRISSEGEFLAEEAWDRNAKGCKEEDAHDDESEDPLECNCLVEELAHAEGGCQDAQGETHGVVLVDGEEEETIYQDTPDSNVG